MHDKLTLEQRSHIERKLLEQRADYETREKHGSFSSASRSGSNNARGKNSDKEASSEKPGADSKPENHYHEMLARINRCLERLETRHCGACIECGEQIGYDRMVASPLAERCLSCKILFEKASLG